MAMTKADEICMLSEEILALIQKNIAGDGKCSFDPVRVEMALEFAKMEIEKSVLKESGEAD